MVDQPLAATIPVSIPHLSGNEWKYVKECLDSGWVSSAGPYVTRFEQEIALYVKAPYAIAFVNGTSALHLALLLSGVEPGDEVIVPTVTFIAPINAVAYRGAKPVFMDCDEYLNIDPKKTKEFCERECHFDGKRLINKKTKAVIKAMLVVHVLGHSANLELLTTLAQKYRIKLIEDAAESIGSFYRTGSLVGRKTGSVGDFGCFSFNGNKIITAGGGGMMVTHDDQIAQKATYLTTQAKDDPELFIHQNIGFNYRLSNLQAAVGCAQLEQLDDFIRIKRENFLIYERFLREINGIELVREPQWGQSNYWLFTIKINRKVFGRSAFELKRELDKTDIQTRYLWRPNHLQAPFLQCQTYRIDRASDVQGTYLNLPSGVQLKEEDIRHVCEILKSSSL